jgi:hypothetical protein
MLLKSLPDGGVGSFDSANIEAAVTKIAKPWQKDGESS